MEKGRRLWQKGSTYLVLSLLVGLVLVFAGCSSGGEQQTGQPTTGKAENSCVQCHEKNSPVMVADWRSSVHAQKGVTCSTCHGDKHNGPSTVDQAEMPTIETCSACHKERVEQYKAGKHALAWVAMEAMPKTAAQPKSIIDKGCASCHQIGKPENACSSCHTRHKYSKAEAAKPQACATCHMGPDHSQWEMYSTSKHGVIYLATEGGNDRAPTCQTCHMSEGNHKVGTAWGFLGLRLEEPDPAWNKDRAKIFEALGVGVDPKISEARLGVVKAGNVMRLTMADWQAERDKMLAICSKCHSSDFARKQLETADDIIRQTDALLAEAITIVQGLYKDGILPKPKDFPASPDVLTFYDAQSPIEQKLYEMLLFHKHKTFQGAFHMNPDYTHWYGWGEMKKDLVEIRHEAEQMRKLSGKK